MKVSQHEVVGEKLFKSLQVKFLILMSKMGSPYWVIHRPSPGDGPWTGGQ